jgi:hypothetical protein
VTGSPTGRLEQGIARVRDPEAERQSDQRVDQGLLNGMDYASFRTLPDGF